MKLLRKIFDNLAQTIVSYMQVDAEQITQLREQITDYDDLFFVFRRPSYLDEALLKAICLRYNLPISKGTFTPNDIQLHRSPSCQTICLRRRPGMELSLAVSQQHKRQLVRAFKALGKRNDSKQCEQKQTGFIPVSIFAGRGPHPWLERLSLPLDFDWLPLGDLWLAVVYSVLKSSLKMDIGPTVPLTSRNKQGFLSHLSKKLYGKEKRVRGARIHPGQTVRHIVFSGSEFEHSLLEHATSTASTPTQSLRYADKLFKEIRAVTNGKVIALLHLVLRPIFRRLFSKIDMQGIENLKACAVDSPIVLLPAHRSHADYLLISFCLYRAGLPIPFIAAGVNLNLFIIGSLLRAGGAFFIRRKIEKDVLYKTILTRYLTYLVKQGHMLEFYIEGGRSRSNRTRSPKLGLLKYVIQCLTTAQRKDVILVPIGLAYEQVPEENAMVKELKGEEKKSESLTQFLGAASLLRNRFGEVCFCVGKPISVKEFAQDSSQGKNPSARRLTEDIGKTISRQFTSLCPVTTSALTSTAFLASRHNLQTSSSLIKTMGVCLQACSSKEYHDIDEESFFHALTTRGSNVVMPRLILNSTLQSHLHDSSSHNESSIRAGLQRTIDDAEKRQLLQKDGDTLCVNTTTGFLKLEYYKNGLMPHLLAPACCILAARNTKWSTESVLYALHQLFAPIFILPEWEVWKETIALEFPALFSAISSDIGTSSKESSLMTRWNKLPVLLLPYLEAFHCALMTAKTCSDGMTEELFFSHMQERTRSDLSLCTETQATTTLSPALEYLVRIRCFTRKRVDGQKGSVLFRWPNPILTTGDKIDLAFNYDSREEFMFSQIELIKRTYGNRSRG